MKGELVFPCNKDVSQLRTYTRVATRDYNNFPTQVGYVVFSELGSRRIRLVDE